MFRLHLESSKKRNPLFHLTEDAWNLASKRHPELSTKIDVNGKDTHPIFQFVKGRSSGLLGSMIKWNFTKFLVSPDGTTVRRYAPKTKPEAMAGDIQALISR